MNRKDLRSIVLAVLAMACAVEAPALVTPAHAQQLAFRGGGINQSCSAPCALADLPPLAAHGSGGMAGTQVISQLTDPQNLSIAGQIDIVAASIEQNGGLLTFVIDTRESIPTTLPGPVDNITFLWLLDADSNPGTGQPHGGVGSDFNVRAVVTMGSIDAFVDVTGSLPGGGLGTVVVDGSQVRMTIGLAQIASPAQFMWRSDAIQFIGGMFLGNGETAIASATTLPFTPPAHVTVTTPLLMLSPSGPASGQLQVEVRDGSGTLLDNDDFTLSYFSSNPGVATVDDAGVVAVHAVPVSFGDTPYISVFADGFEADNAVVIRSTSMDLGVVHTDHPGDHVSFYLPEVIEGVDLGAITNDYQVVAATDHAYRAELVATGITPFGGGTQYLVLDVTNDAATVPCGASGNPVRLGWRFGVPIHNSCYIVNDPPNQVPQWGVFFHELGHNFTGPSTSFIQFVNASPPQTGAYAEGLATLVAMWAWVSMSECRPGIGAASWESIDGEFTYLKAVRFADALADYQAGGANYSALDPDILDGILFELYDSFGAKVWFDLFSTFLPPDQPLPCTIDTQAKQATWVIAAVSASAGQDLRAMFATQYGFPVDGGAWPAILACVQARINARDFDALDLNDDGVVTPCECPGGVCETCTQVSDCADLDADGRRDDNCVWWACESGICTGTGIVFADMGGQFGACPPDGTADGNDRFHALNCFSNVNNTGGVPYPCEASPPAAFNVDAGGQFGSCVPDGVCDGNDAFAALNAFSGIGTCSCPAGAGPGPGVPDGSARRVERER